jgi:hypothetical protein
VTTQAISWSIFSATVVMLVVLLQQLVAGVAHCFRCWALGAGTCMVVAQAVRPTFLPTINSQSDRFTHLFQDCIMSNQAPTHAHMARLVIAASALACRRGHVSRC